MANRWGNVETVSDFTFLSSKINADGDGSHKIKRCLPLGRIAMTNLDSVLKSRDIILLTVSHNQSYDFSSTHVWMWELDHEEGWVLKNWHFQTVVLEKTLQCPLGSKETKPVNPKGNQSLNIHWKDCCWSSNILAIWCEELTHWKKPWCWEKLKAREKERQRMRWLDCITDLTLSKLREIVMDWEALRAAVPELQRVRQDLVTDQQQLWSLLFPFSYLLLAYLFIYF